MSLATVHHLPVTPQRRAPRVNSWRWNELEDEALEPLPAEIERLYLRGIRKYMDYATGITGRKRRVSTEGFRELLEYHPPAGSREKARIYSRQQITRMLDKLEEAGLIERLHRGKGVKAAMEFRLPLACQDLDQQRAESEHGGASRENPHQYWAESGNSEQGASTEERSTSGYPVTPTPSLRSGVVDPEPKKSSPKSALEYTEEFEQAWNLYPKRSGSNPKREAFKSWRARLAEGVRADDMIAGVQRYAAHVSAKGSNATEFVMQGKRFFGPSAEFENDWFTPAPSANGYGAQGGNHANRQGFDQQRSERDRIAQRLADPNDSGWIDGLFDEEEPTGGAGEPDLHPARGDLPQDMADGVQHGKHADSGEARGCYIDGEVVGTSDQSGRGHGNREDQGRGRRVAAERCAPGQKPAAETGGFWNA